MDPIGLLIFVLVFCAIFYVVQRFLPDPIRLIAYIILGLVFIIGLLNNLGFYGHPWFGFHY